MYSMRRSFSVTRSNQGSEQTCSLHTIARLFVRNIIQPDVCPLTYQGRSVPPFDKPVFRSRCEELLETYYEFEIDRLSPERCGGIRPYISTLMYLYAYYSILNHHPESACIGAYMNANMVTLGKCIQDNYIPPQLESKQEDIDMVMANDFEVHFTQFSMNPKSSKPFSFYGPEDPRFLTLLQRCSEENLYVGIHLGKRGEHGHSVVISDYNKETNRVFIKNSWGFVLDEVPATSLKGPMTSLQSDKGMIDINWPIQLVFYLGTHPVTDFDLTSLRVPTHLPAQRVGTVRKSTSRKLLGKSRKSRSLLKK